MVGNGPTGPGDWGGTRVSITGSTGTALNHANITVTSSDCCAQRFAIYTEEKKEEKKKPKKNNPMPPWLRAKTKQGQF